MVKRGVTHKFVDSNFALSAEAVSKCDPTENRTPI